ncbi:hypothetical protein KJ780_03215 [Candidatus Micrarchaeota archaeon]|nr:hypothetical protein [Candidatus Micrarchaeota archaeon]
MANISKIFNCSCGTSFPFAITTDLEVSEITAFAKCPQCNSGMNISLSTMSSSAPKPPVQEESPLPNLDETIFSAPEMPSEDIKNLIED